MSFTSGKHIRNPEVQIRILKGNLDYERHESERAQDEIRRLREQLRQANQGKLHWVTPITDGARWSCTIFLERNALKKSII